MRLLLLSALVCTVYGAGQTQIVWAEPNYLGLAIEQKKKNQFPAAFALFDKEIALHPKNAQAYLERGILHRDLRQDKECLRDLNKAVELDPKSHGAYSARAWFFDQQDEFEKACADYRVCLKLNPKDSFSGCCLADNLGQLGKTKEALAAIEQVLRYSPNDGHARRQRAGFLPPTKEYLPLRIKDLTFAINTKTSKYEMLYALRAEDYKRLNDWKSAIKDYDVMLQRNPTDEDTCFLRGDCYEKLGNLDKAVSDYSKAIDNAMEAPQAYLKARARCYEKLGKKKEAQADLKAAQKSN